MTPEKLSKTIALALRHRPELFGIELDADGWTSVSGLLKGLRSRDSSVSREDIDAAVAAVGLDKKRFEYDQYKTRIRAFHGHSVTVNHTNPETPPDVLFHGTVGKFLASIKGEGLRPMNRQFVHLTEDTGMAITVGSRRGTATVLTVDAAGMVRDGFKFIKAGDVWLTGTVPLRYITFPKGNDN